jgi:uncharacterized protein (DUF983 family)
VSTAEEPTIMIAFLRGLTRRCPRCGRGKLFRRWFDFAKVCPRCGLRFEREEGAFLGSLTINYAVTGLAFFALLIGWMVVTGGRVRWVPLVLASIAVVIVVPLLFYPFAKTLWAALDFLIYRSDPSYPGKHDTEKGPDRGGGSA